jgi:CHAT domain-containing protein
MTSRNAFLLKRALLLFWTGWLTVVFTTNVFDACKAMRLLAGTWLFASGNFDFLVGTTARYGTPTWINAVLFGGVIVWEAVDAVLFWVACLRLSGKSKGMPTVYPVLGWASRPERLDDATEDCPYAHPYYWAAFILTGDPD